MNDKGRPDEGRPLLHACTLPFFAFASCSTGARRAEETACWHALPPREGMFVAAGLTPRFDPERDGRSDGFALDMGRVRGIRFVRPR